MIFLIESTLILLIFKKIQKNKKKIKIYKKRGSWGTNFENLAIFLPINTGFLNTLKRGGQFRTHSKNTKTLKPNSFSQLKKKGAGGASLHGFWNFLPSHLLWKPAAGPHVEFFSPTQTFSANLIFPTQPSPSRVPHLSNPRCSPIFFTFPANKTGAATTAGSLLLSLSRTLPFSSASPKPQRNHYPLTNLLCSGHPKPRRSRRPKPLKRNKLESTSSSLFSLLARQRRSFPARRQRNQRPSLSRPPSTDQTASSGHQHPSDLPREVKIGHPSPLHRSHHRPPAAHTRSFSLGLATTGSREEGETEKKQIQNGEGRKNKNRFETKEKFKIYYCLCVVSLVAGDGDLHRWCGKIEGKKTSRIPCSFWFLTAAREPTRCQWRWRVERRAASAPAAHEFHRTSPCTVMDFLGFIL